MADNNTTKKYTPTYQWSVLPFLLGWIYLICLLSMREKSLLGRKLNLVISSDDYITFLKALKEREDIEFPKEKEAI